MLRTIFVSVASMVTALTKRCGAVVTMRIPAAHSMLVMKETILGCNAAIVVATIF